MFPPPVRALFTWICLVQNSRVMGDLMATQVNQSLANQSLRQANHSATRQDGKAPAVPVSKPQVVANHSAGRDNTSIRAVPAAEAVEILAAQPLPVPENVSGPQIPPASNTTALRGAQKSSAGWVGCWYYGCRSGYHPTFYCQCNAACRRFGNCCWDFNRKCWYMQDNSRRRRTPKPVQDSRRRRTAVPSPPPSPSDGLVTAYHQTSPQACKAIVNSAFRPGSDGHCGGAIYFAMSPEATKTKAIGTQSQSGCVIEAKIEVGRVKYEGANCGHKWNKDEFKQTGYDSISFDPGDGPEVVIFEASRVKRMRIIPYNNAWKPEYRVR